MYKMSKLHHRKCFGTSFARAFCESKLVRKHRMLALFMKKSMKQYTI